MKLARWLMVLFVASATLGCSRQPLAPDSGASHPASATKGAVAEKYSAGTAVEGRAWAPLTDTGNDGRSRIATGAIDFDVPASVFGTPTDIQNRLHYTARHLVGRSPEGHFSYVQAYGGDSFEFSGVITCIHVYDYDGGTNNRAKVGGRIEQSNDPTIPIGTYIWWQQIDNSKSPGNLPDKSTISGFGNEAANEAFCNNPAPPGRPFDVDNGNIHVKVLPVHGGGRGVVAS